MDLLVLNTDLEAVGLVDTFESLIWTERYSQCGDFEIYTAMSLDEFLLLQEDCYLSSRESDVTMIIESIEIASDIEDGNRFIVTGRSLESILARRIIWNQTILTGNFQNGIKKLLYDNVISPIDADRKIENFIFEESIDPLITELTIDAQFTCDNLYEAISSLCGMNNVGFKVSLNDTNQFVFKLYAGKDRSYDQTEFPYVIFSPNFDNIITSNLIESKKTYKNVTLVAGEGEGQARKTVTVGSGTGLERREMYTDARDISTTAEDDRKLTSSEYNALLIQRGDRDLAENYITKTFEGQVDTTRSFVYGEDFGMGDILQIENEYGIESKSRVTEIVRSQDENGIEVCPTFTIVE